MLLLCSACALFGSVGNAGAADVSFLDPQGMIAAAQRQHFFDVILIMMIVIMPVLIGVPLLAWRYRYRNTSARYTPDWRWSVALEVPMWGVPFAVVIVLAVWQAHDTSALSPYRPIKTADQPLKVDVIGYDWKWLFVYPQLHIASMGQLVFPRHRSLSMRLTSDSVMQSFFIPALGSQIYAMPAMQTRLHLVADSTGRFLGENTQYDGLGFQHQKFVARATTADGFQAWVAGVKTNGVPLTAKVYGIIREDNTVSEIRTALKADTMPPDAVFFDHVQPDLFWNVIMSFHGGPSGSHAMVSANDAKARFGAQMASRNRPHTAGKS